MKDRPGDQPLPIVNDAISIQDLVIDDIVARRKLGIERYGTALQAHNGRDALRDAYEEAIDLTMYLKQCIVERDDIQDALEAKQRDDEIERARLR